MGPVELVFLVNRGVLTDISSCDTLEIEVNQGDYTVINEVLKILKIEKPVKITQDIQLPIGAGIWNISCICIRSGYCFK